MDALSFFQTVAGFTQSQTSQQSENKPFKLGTVDPAYVASTFPGTLPKVTFDGESTVSGKLYPVMSPYWPQPSDRVVLAPIGNTYLILGPVDYDTAAYLGGSVKVVGNITTENGEFQALRTTNTDTAFYSKTDADSIGRFLARVDGLMEWGPGTAGRDTNLYRSAANELKTDDAFNVAGDYVAGATNGVNAVATTSLTNTTTSASYANLAGTGSQTSFSITKRFSSSQTRLKVHMSASFWAGGGVFPVGAMFGVLINGVDTDMFLLNLETSTASNNKFGSGTAFITGLAAGTYTVQGRWKRTSAGGTPTRDAGNWLTITAEEVSA